MALRFRKIVDSQPVVDYLYEQIKTRLDGGQKVLWLVSGGSAIPIAVAMADKLAGTDISNLTLTLADERYGEPGHADSNWRQLMDTGLSLPGATLMPVLTGRDFAGTAQAWEAGLQAAFANCDYKLGFLGIGPDGHTSGILPHSPAVTATGLVTAYDGGSYQRITTTPEALRQLDEAVVYAVGEAKRETLEALQTDRPLADQPAQILKELPRCVIFNDLTGEPV